MRLSASNDPLSARRVLLVEDDEDIVESVASVLEDAGYEVEASRNGLDAIRRLRESPSDLVILDLMMPVMDGWEFRAAQRADRALADIPVIVITADRNPKAQAIHADAFLPKPFGANALLKQVEETFAERDRRVRNQRLEETDRLALLGAIAAGVGHEINNPLSSALGSLEMLDERLPALLDETRELRASASDEETTAAITRIEQTLTAMQSMIADGRNGAARVSHMVRNLQSLSRRAKNDRAEVDLHRVLEFSMVMAWSQIRYRAKLIRSFAPIPHVWGNEGRLNQVFLNLLVNAVQSMPAGHAIANEVEVATRTEGEFVVVEIRDNGQGMTRALQARIFEPFFTTKGEGEAAGIGLSICREVVSEHGGRLEVMSAIGRGTTLRVRLPAHTPKIGTGPTQAKDARPPSIAPKSVPAPAGVRPKVWVLDDEHLVAKTVQRILERSYDVFLADDALDVLSRLESGQTYDAFVCDLMMPGMSGMELWARVQQQWPHLATRMVFASGGAFTPEATEFTEQPDRLFVQKPFEISTLRSLIERVTRG
jgi:signal transduction histidine kinase